MALSILDGNKTATTLSTIVTSGQHIPAHTVISLGTQAVADIKNAISGSSISISSLPAISGTVTIGTGTAQIGTVTASLSNAVSPVLPSIYDGDPYPVGSKIIPVGGWSQENDGAHWQCLSISDQGSVLAQLSTGYSRIGVVTVGNSVTISSLPVSLSTTTIGGSARLNVTLSSATTIGATAPSYGNLHGGSDGTNLRAISVDTSGRTVVTG
jgi:hypothetical protein